MNLLKYGGIYHFLFSTCTKLTSKSMYNLFSYDSSSQPLTVILALLFIFSPSSNLALQRLHFWI